MEPSLDFGSGCWPPPDIGVLRHTPVYDNVLVRSGAYAALLRWVAVGTVQCIE
jgi:hypothetical protein